MKKIYLFLLSLIAGSVFCINAQQLPNAGFENWESSQSVPWTGGNGTVAIGYNPNDWCISHVMGITSREMFIISAGTGKVALGEKTTGYTGNGVKLYNKETGAAGITRNVPGYVTLGTTWSTADGTTSSTHDGGTWGGISFSNRPDAIQFMYKHEYASSDTSEPCSFIAYMWKGSYTQASVPVTITAGSSRPKTTTMTNRERNILGKECKVGGAATASSDFELIAVIEEYSNVPKSDWSLVELAFDYKSDATPTMFNVIFSTNDYFNANAASTINNSISIDDVKLLYYSRLASLSINGVAVDGFNSKTYSYTVDSEMPDESAFEFTTLGNSGSAVASISLDTENAVATITVTNSNNNGADVDGQTSHTYTIQFNKESGEGGGTEGGGDNEEDDTVEYCQPTGVDGRYYPNNKTAHPDRVVNSINFTDGTNSVTVEGAPAPVGMTGTRAIVYDRTATVLTTTAGSTINATVDGSGSWMNTFVYADFDLNGFTSADKVYYNYEGQDPAPANEVGTSFSFNIPATVQPGEYRVRYILDWWNNFDPCVYGQAAGENINDNGEYVIDFIISVAEGTPEVAEYTVTINQPAEGGAITVSKGTDAVNSGDKVAEGTELTLAQQAAEGFSFVNFLVNGEVFEGTTLTVNADVTISATFEANAPAVAEYCTLTGTTNRTDARGISSLTVTDNLGAQVTVTGPGVGTRQALYVDQTSVVLNSAPGATVTVKNNGEGNWMHTYLYIDLNQNGVFEVNEANCRGASVDGELLSHTGYTGMQTNAYNKPTDPTVYSDGTPIDNGTAYSCTMPSFTLPADLAPGTYRVRHKVDWNCVDPCGRTAENGHYADFIADNGGGIIDFTLVIEGTPAVAEYTVTINQPAEGGAITVSKGTDAVNSGDKVAEGTELTLAQQAAEGFSFVSFLVNGEAFEGTTLTVEADVTISATFEANAPEVTPAGDPVNYEGNLQIVIGEAVLPSEATVSVTPMSDGSYRLVLPDFSLDLGEGPQSLGDIVVDNVQITEDGGNKTYAGSVNDFTLANGEIRTNITLTGTEDANGALQLTIQVDWLDVTTGEVLMPIMVYFNGQKEGTEPPAEVEYCIPVRDVTGATTVNRNDRYVTKITFNDGVNTLDVAGNGWSSGRDVFCDHTDQTFVTNPGASVNVKTTAGGEWMNYFVYIDFDKNGFTYDDLVFTNFTGNHVNIATEFVVNIPAEVAYGEYRMRVLLDWKNEDPCIYGVNQGSDNGECCVDLMIRLKSDNHDAPRTITVSANDDAYGTVAITDPATEGNTVSTDQKSVTMVATAADGYTFANWTDAAGNVVSEDATYTYSGAADASFTANFGVTFSYFVGEGGSAAFMVEGEAIASDVILLPGTEVTVNVTPNTGMQANIIVNGMAVDFTNNTYTFTIDRASSVVVSFVDAVYTLTIEVIGDGEVKVTDGGTMAVGPQGNEYKTGDNITGKALRIFMKPAEGAELLSASFVDEGSESKTLTTREVTAADYQGWYYTASAQPTGNRVLTVEFTEAAGEVEYCQPEPVAGRAVANGKTNRTDRAVNSLELSDGESTATIAGPGSSYGRDVYVDQTATSFSTNAGKTVAVSVNGTGEWMNSFFYVDFDLNGFDVEDRLYTNFTGEHVDVAITFSFDVPEVAPGNYRARYILDWDQEQGPCFYGQSGNDNGEAVIDFIITVVDSTSGIGSIGIDPANGPVEYYNLQGVRVAAENLVPGFYVVRQGEKAAKVFINK